MKWDFDQANDGRYHQYCVHCRAETVERVYEEEKTYYFCLTCRRRCERSVVIDPGIQWWVGADGEYWHESAGVFVRNPAGDFLFFERTVFPFALTVPAGHVDFGEKPATAAVRELLEETGISAPQQRSIATENIIGDSCRRGADAHRWHAYLLVLDKSLTIDIREEGEHPVWLSLEQARKQDLTYPVEFMIDKYANALQQPFSRLFSESVGFGAVSM